MINFFLVKYYSLFQLENTEKGGLTAFPQAGIAAKPTKGSAIFWYNLKRNGEVDTTTFHCACPVVLGHKTSNNAEIPFSMHFQMFEIFR